MIKKISNDATYEISSIFCGDKNEFFEYKTLSKLFEFFNHYFNMNDSINFYTAISRKNYVNDKLKWLIEKDKINEFFDVILSVEYIQKEEKAFEISDTEAFEKSKKILIKLNNIFKKDFYLIVKKNNKFYLEHKNDELVTLGSGGFAEIFKVNSSGRILKKLKKEFWLDNKIVSRFKREFEIMKDIQNIDGIIKVFDFSSSDNSYTMEFGGITLYEHVENNNFSEEIKLKYVEKILNIVSEVHKRKYIHRDLSPSNIFINNENIKIADFGLGKNIDLLKNHSHKTNSTKDLGQMYYCAPEQLKSLGDGTAKSDVFSLGKIINFIFNKSPQENEHILKNLVEKSTINEPDKRFSDSTAMLYSFKDSQDLSKYKKIKEIALEKIKNSEFDDNVKFFIDFLSTEEISKYLLNKEYLIDIKLVNSSLLKFMNLSENNALKIIKGVEMKYKKLCEIVSKRDNVKIFDLYDNFALFSYIILSEKEGLFPLEVREYAANILKYVAFDVWRYKAQNFIEELKFNDIDETTKNLLN
ncbi:protein kinase domain-containing protein [[Mycoplasma] mobile]|uniref:Serine/threonine kinase n=1 Tax=Mycoplasma mobile (strain ATCC 43663 / 163K / NCTC 11711) TaxID=267748 RepID=Q6KHD8_MYCM1|nr:protein kinase [[Mycoplasma] mobile]AAT27992.1 serine/threonine kinase [Mycoplasma mobile 163K]